MSRQVPAGNGRGAVLAIETATSETVVAVQTEPVAPVFADRWPSRQAHGERLLASIERVLERAGIGLSDVTAIGVGTGPGSFTGLRIGLAAAKGLAFGLGIPLLGVPTAEALALAVTSGSSASSMDDATAPSVAVLQPAGPSGRYRTVVSRNGDGWHAGPSELLLDVTTADAARSDDASSVAVDLPDVHADAADAGRRALEALPEALIEAARDRLAAGRSDDLAELVPAYVTPPRGAVTSEGSIEWSLGPR